MFKKLLKRVNHKEDLHVIKEETEIQRHKIKKVHQPNIHIREWTEWLKYRYLKLNLFLIFHKF
jgi:hypothetical protein